MKFSRNIPIPPDREAPMPVPAEFHALVNPKERQRHAILVVASVAAVIGQSAAVPTYSPIGGVSTLGTAAR